MASRRAELADGVGRDIRVSVGVSCSSGVGGKSPPRACGRRRQGHSCTLSACLAALCGDGLAGNSAGDRLDRLQQRKERTYRVSFFPMLQAVEAVT